MGGPAGARRAPGSEGLSKADPSSAAPAQERAEERSSHVCPARGDGSVPHTLIRVYDARTSFESPDVHICLRLASGTFAATRPLSPFPRRLPGTRTCLASCLARHLPATALGGSLAAALLVLRCSAPHACNPMHSCAAAGDATESTTIVIMFLLSVRPFSTMTARVHTNVIRGLHASTCSLRARGFAHARTSHHRYGNVKSRLRGCEDLCHPAQISLGAAPRAASAPAARHPRAP